MILVHFDTPFRAPLLAPLSETYCTMALFLTEDREEGLGISGTYWPPPPPAGDLGKEAALKRSEEAQRFRASHNNMKVLLDGNPVPNECSCWLFHLIVESRNPACWADEYLSWLAHSGA